MPDGSVLPPGNVAADFGRFVFPGWGASTFRVRSASGASLAPFGSVGFTPATTAGELPFTWGGFAPSKTMGTTISYTEGGPPVPIDSTGFANIQDPVLDGLNNYDGASLTVTRQNLNPPPFSFPEDNFGFNNGNGLTLVGNAIQKGGSTIATFNSFNGTLTVNFTDNFGQVPTSADADNVLRQITYFNTSVIPPLPMMGMPSLTLAVTFDNGVGAQALCLVDVDITPLNSPPVIIDLGPADVFDSGAGTPVTLDNDGDVDIQDDELDALNFGTRQLRHGDAHNRPPGRRQHGRRFLLRERQRPDTRRDEHPEGRPDDRHLRRGGRDADHLVYDGRRRDCNVCRRGQHPTSNPVREYQWDAACQCDPWTSRSTTVVSGAEHQSKGPPPLR